MSKEMTKEIKTPEEALAILRSGSSLRFDEARKFLKENYPEIWNKYEQSLKAAEAKRAAAEADVLKNIEMIAKNRDELNLITNHYDMGQFGIREFVNPIMDRVDMYQTDEKTGKEVLLTKEEKTDYFKVLYSSARLEVEEAFVQSKSFHDATPKEKKAMVREAIEDNMLVKVYRVAAASSMEMPTDKEENPDSVNFFKYNKRQADKFRKLAKDVVATDKKIKMNTDAVLLSVADTAARTEGFANRLHEVAKSFEGAARQKLNAVSDHFKKRKSNLELLANKVSNGKYQEKIKPVVKAVVKGGKDSIKDNIIKIGTNIVVGGGIAAAIGAGSAAAPLVLAYGVYHGVTSWIWPLVTETRKVHRLAKEAGNPISWKEARKKGVKIAVQTKKVVQKDKNGNPILDANGREVVKKKNPYVVRGVINFVLGVGGGIVLSKALRAKEAIENGADIVTTAIDSVKSANEAATNAADVAGAAADVAQAGRAQAMSFRLFRTLTPAGAQLLDAGVSVVTDPHDATTRKRAGWEALGAIATAGIGAASLGISEYTATHEGGLKGLWEHIFHKETAEDVVSQVDPIAQEPQPEVVAEPVEFEPFPRAWNKDLGISEKRFNIMMSRLNNGKIADFDAQSLDRAYMNMDEEFMSHFPGKTKMQVFYDFTELARNGQRHQYVLGNAEHGFYINTPTERVRIITPEQAAGLTDDEKAKVIVDAGIVEQAKKALANGDKLLMSRLHGRGFLQRQLENVNANGMTDEKMNQVIEIAMRTYDPNQVSGATAEIHKLLPDLSKDQLKTIREIVDYNRSYEQNGEIMDQLGRALGCGEKNGIDYEAAADLLNRRNAILSLSNGPSVPLSQNGPECPTSTMLHVRRTVAPQMPEINDEVVIEDDPIIVPETKSIPEQLPAVKKLAYTPVAKVEEPMGREYLVKNVSDHWYNAEKQVSRPDDEVEVLIQNQEALEKHGIFGVFKMKRVKSK